MSRQTNCLLFLTISFVVVELLAMCTPSGASAADVSPSSERAFRAGAYAIDVSPVTLPAIVNGYTFERTVNVVHDPLHVRCLVLDDGSTRVAIVVVDICVMPRDLIDRAKQLAHELTDIPTDRMLISATHTHSAPSVLPALGSGVDPHYVEYLPGRIAEGIRLAAENLAPAQIGWAVVNSPEHTHSRRWIMRPDRIGTDPFGLRRERAKMCPAYQDPAAVGPAGPVDADLSLVSVQSCDGRPIALLANYSMHYFHATPISAGYYGRFVRHVTRLIGVDDRDPAFVAMMSQGTSGDQMYMDYSRPKPELDIDTYASGVAQVAFEAYEKIEYRSWVPLAMAEAILPLRRRVPDAERLAWAKQMMAAVVDRPPKNRPEIFAREQIYLAADPTAELKLQALRIGDVGITAIPCEVYGITGLKIKTQSPLDPTFNITLANGEEGYIPPPEQHFLGGYSTWEARTAGLEEQAEAKIVDAVLGLFERISDKKRREVVHSHGDYAKAILASEPVAYWRMSEFGGPTAVDDSGKENHGAYEDGVAFYLPGPPLARSDCIDAHKKDGAQRDGEEQREGRAQREGEAPAEPSSRRHIVHSARVRAAQQELRPPVNRAAHFAGGRMRAAVKDLGRTYSVQMWIYNGMPGDARQVAGYFFSRGVDGAEDAPGDHLGIGGTAGATDRLFFFNGNKLGQMLEGSTRLELKRWYHVAFVRDGRNVTVYLDGNPKPEIAGQADIAEPRGVEHLFIGGRNDNFANFAGKVDEVAVYDRALAPKELTRHKVQASREP